MTQLDVLATGYGLVEGPTVLPDGALAFSDVLGGGVFELGADGEVTVLVPKRRGVGGIAVHADGGIVCTGRDVIRVHERETTTLFSAEGAAWNDVGVDHRGRVWAGTVRFAVFDPDAAVVPGEVWRVDGEHQGEPVIEGITHCNGIAFSPSGDRVFVSDTRANVVVSTDSTGADRRELPVPLPDGLAVDTEGFLWVASYGDRRVLRVDPSDGTVERTVDVGVPVTSVCLTPAGALYITTATHAGQPGSVLRTRVDVAGLPLPAATVGAAP